MIKTQHCPNCEATTQELSAFRREVSDALYDYFGDEHIQWGGPLSHLFIISTPKPDLLDRVLSMTSSLVDKETLRDRLEAEGLEIREKE